VKSDSVREPGAIRAFLAISLADSSSFVQTRSAQTRKSSSIAVLFP
jgi:hypothetical protein